MSDTQTWSMIHAERSSLADTLAGLTPDQWATPSLCAGWNVQQLAAHVLAACRADRAALRVRHGAQRVPLRHLHEA